MALETEIAGHHWDNVTSRDSEKTYNPMLWQAANDLVGAVDMNIWLGALGVPKGSFDEVVVRQPSFVAGLESVLRADNLDAWRDWLAWQVIRSNRPVPLAGLRRGELRLLRPHPHRHPRAACALEARRLPRRGRPRRGGRTHLCRAALPPGGEDCDG